ncbi:MAG: hypothetical protein ACYC2O_01340, partial [Microthrixaceae bacterium]
VRRMRKAGGRAGEYADAGCLADFGDVFAVIVAIVLIVLVVVVVLPLAWGLLELLLILLLAAVVWAVRVLCRRPWSIVHRAVEFADELDRWRVVGWRQAHRVMVEAADSIERSGRAAVEPPLDGWAA